MAARSVTGIDRVDLAYGRHFAAVEGVNVAAAYCRAAGPHVMGPQALRKIVRQAQAGSWEHASLAADVNFVRIRNWLAGEEPGPESARKLASPPVAHGARLAAHLWRARCRWGHTIAAVPRNGIYLNIAEHWLEHPRYFGWLADRPDVEAVFFVHDLLPLDYPEYFRPDYDAIFQRRFDTLARFGTAFIVSTNVVRERLRQALVQAGKSEVPIFVGPLPSPLALSDAEVAGLDLPKHPYFILVSTIEPRKNHLLVLNIWRELAALLGDETPRLMLIGSRGWEDEQIVDMLDRCEGIAKYVLRAARISRHGLTWLIRHAQALLMPSFDEGYGLPLVEALSLETPVIASNIETFREVARGCALLLSPIDGVAWREAIVALSKRSSPAWQAAKAIAEPFRPPDWDGYFSGLDGFLNALR